MNFIAASPTLKQCMLWNISLFPALGFYFDYCSHIKEAAKKNIFLVACPDIRYPVSDRIYDVIWRTQRSDIRWTDIQSIEIRFIPNEYSFWSSGIPNVLRKPALCSTYIHNVLEIIIFFYVQGNGPECFTWKGYCMSKKSFISYSDTVPT